MCFTVAAKGFSLHNLSVLLLSGQIGIYVLAVPYSPSMCVLKAHTLSGKYGDPKRIILMYANLWLLLRIHEFLLNSTYGLYHHHPHTILLYPQYKENTPKNNI